MDVATRQIRHGGMDYITFLSHLNSVLAPKTYFEIGTNLGDSLRVFTCDAVSVDPTTQIERHPGHDVIGGRRRMFFFQMTSDEFFRANALRSLFPEGPDIAFLDGLHLFEALLRDFINTERACHDRSIIFLHDCLPLNERMAERAPRADPREDDATAGFWCGDVWRLIPILKTYRPDLKLVMLDCPPTGLVACMNLDPNSRVLHDRYYDIVEEYRRIDLGTFGLERLWDYLPVQSTLDLLRPPYDLTTLFTVR